VNSVHGTYQNGTVVLDEPANFPEGAHVRVTLAGARATDDDFLPDGRPWPKSPEEIAAFVAEMDAIPPMDMTDEEIERWEAIRKEERETQKALFAEWAEETGRLFS